MPGVPSTRTSAWAPKRVIILPAGVQAPRWIIDEIKPGRYKLKINGDPTGELESMHS
ncbi:hypothetical protein BD779DRAFT_1675010 [Infundibulicybe gibba]|nr:hypothetical protein BD779DRAFT_1675010 [Infundibulicybe gibba]